MPTIKIYSSQQTASELPIHLMTAPRWNSLVSPGIIHSVGYTIPLGLCFATAFLSHHQHSKLTKLQQTSGSEHSKAEIKTFPRASTYGRHCQQALTRLQERGREFGEQCLLWHICPQGTKRTEPAMQAEKSLSLGDTEAIYTCQNCCAISMFLILYP